MASLSERAAVPDGDQQDSGALFDIWAAMAARQVLEPDLDDILRIHLGRLYRQLQTVAGQDG